MIRKYYRKDALTKAKISQLLVEWNGPVIKAGNIKTETCFYVETNGELMPKSESKLIWLLRETFKPDDFGKESFILNSPTIFEAGPRLNFETTYSSTAVSICHSCEIKEVLRIERSLRVGVSISLNEKQKEELSSLFYDRMTEIIYEEPLTSFESNSKPEPVKTIPLLEEGIDVLLAINKELGLSMDKQDIETIIDLFTIYLGRNPTDVEIYKYAQVNSEHSRHLFFGGIFDIDGCLMEDSLMDIIKDQWRRNPRNSLVAFDGSIIRGYMTEDLIPSSPIVASASYLKKVLRHFAGHAETHCYPTYIDPYNGAATGPGGRIRDNQVGAGRGGRFGVGGAGYFTGNLHIPGYILPWEQNDWIAKDLLTLPLKIMIKASDGASDYHNCIGEPLIYGATRMTGLLLPDGEYHSFFKPILYTVGTGQVENDHIKKGTAQKGMLLIQVGGPAYRIGLGGASGSSKIQSQEDDTELDFSAVQRGDPEMEQRMNRLIRACTELGNKNPIVLMQDLGAGGDCNAVSELIHPAGARIDLRAIPLGDKSLSVLEYWCNESQERNALLIRPEKLDLIQQICEREDIPFAVIGEITGDGKIVLYDENDNSCPVDLPLDKILEKVKPKTFEMEHLDPILEPLLLPKDLTVFEALDMVLRSIGSKRHLIIKGDRSVTGLVSQQQCVGPNQLTLSNYAIMAQSHFGLTGTALSLGEQPLKGLVSPWAMAHMAVSEALFNIIGAKITKLEDVKLLANWMLAAKLPGEGAWLYDAVCALRDILLELGIAIIGGKDSLSMALEATGPDNETHIVKAPGQLIISAMAPMDDITNKVTPDLKKSGNVLLFINPSNGKNRLGGSTLAQVHSQIGDDCPDMESASLFKRSFEAVQMLIDRDLICSIHDRSDGGLVVTLLEMAFAGNVGLDISIESNAKTIETLFNEELGLVMETDKPEEVLKLLTDFGVPVEEIGAVGNRGGKIKIEHNNILVLDEEMTALRQIWEATSTEIDKLQANPECVEEEAQVNAELIKDPPYRLTFEPSSILNSSNKPKIAIIRERGSNGDKEMTSAFYLAGFDPWDATMTDIIKGNITLDQFKGIAFVGGFTFGDVLDAGKGWAGVIKFNPEVKEQFDNFYARSDTFSFGVCNGCQLMALLGWVPWSRISDEKQPRFISNNSGRFESRFPTVEIQPSPAIMFKGMEGSRIGVWSAHAQGRLFVPDKQMLHEIVEKKLVPIAFVDISGKPTEVYPFNPNGSPFGIAGLCSENGRHLAMMPHSERSFLLWQLPWIPEEWKDLEASPWLKMFQNAYSWCIQQEENK
ncbi:MAG: phosphoribosylformylglycinamidine synthase [Candidatus Pacebacteria bacterium]|nr:phosphoribosylformylglycinamidine synthase [Candidatus Paceibacterota bacterium]